MSKKYSHNHNNNHNAVRNNNGKSNFVNNSSVYCETDLLKYKILSPILEKYNQAILDNENKSSVLNFTNVPSYIIHNNNIKYYLLIVNKNLVNSDTNNYKIMYFFPEIETNTNSDYYSEINNLKGVNEKNVFSKNIYLFEGYMYGTLNYLITDILYADSVVSVDYQCRQAILNEMFYGNFPKMFNGNITLDIHPTFKQQQESEAKAVFKNNFLFKDELNSTEYIINDKLIKTQKYTPINNTIVKKLLKKEDNLQDVYYVYNIDTNNKEGIAYIRTLSESIKMRELLVNDSVAIDCDFNQLFKKWHPRPFQKGQLPN
jgi:hypothetical protein